MSTNELQDALNRRSFLNSAAMTIAAAPLGIMDFAAAQPDKTTPSRVAAIKPGTNTSFKALKQINAGLLNVGYAEDGRCRVPPHSVDLTLSGKL